MTSRHIHHEGVTFPSVTSTVALLLLSTIIPERLSAFRLPVDASIPGNPNHVFVETLEYLVEYGYLSMDSGKMPSSTDIQTAMSELQSFMDLSPTGTLDLMTLEAVRTPRCGLKDPVGEMTNDVNRPQYTLYGQRWNKTDLTYRILHFPRGVRRSKFRAAIEDAFRLWSDVTPLAFREVKRRQPADIDIGFYSAFHNDEFPFDNAGGVIAHPMQTDDDEPGGAHVARIHFDGDEDFTFESYEGINLFQAMAHQIGHALGLGHSPTHDSVMSPCIKPYMTDFRLSEADVTGIQAIYGSPNTSVELVQPIGPLLPKSFSMPNVQQSEPMYLCAERPLDAVAVLAGDIYAFKGNRYWQFRAPNDLLSPVAGSLITDRWPGLLSGPHAVYQRHTDNKVVFIKGGHMLIYDIRPKGKTSSTKLPRIPVRDLQLPRGIEAALSCEEWPLSTYLIRKGRVWHFNDQTETLVAGPLQVQDMWDGLPKRVDAAFTYNGDSYFIHDSHYWKVDGSSRRVAEGYPRNFHTDFLGC